MVYSCFINNSLLTENLLIIFIFKYSLINTSFIRLKVVFSSFKSSIIFVLIFIVFNVLVNEHLVILHLLLVNRVSELMKVNNSVLALSSAMIVSLLLVLPHNLLLGRIVHSKDSVLVDVLF